MITEFLKPKTIIEAVQLKQATPDAVYMAGGSWINSSRSAMNPETVISLNELDLNFIKQDQDTLRIGAMTTLQDILDNDLIPDYIKGNLKLFRNRNIRNQGTLAGAIAAKNPAFSILTVLIAAGAKLETPTEEISVEKLAEFCKQNSKNPPYQRTSPILQRVMQVFVEEKSVSKNHG